MTNPTLSLTKLPSELQQYILKYVGNPVTRRVSKLFKEQTDKAIDKELKGVWNHLNSRQAFNLPVIQEVYMQTHRLAPAKTALHLPPISLERFLELEGAIKIRDTLTFWEHLPGGIEHIAQQNFKGVPLSKIKEQLTNWINADEYIKNLQVVELVGQNLRYLPPEIGLLQNLEGLPLNNNLLTELPPEISHLQDLQVVYLHNNQLTMLPKEVGQLQNLKELFLHNNQLTTLPKEIGPLQKLQKVYLNNNPITALPETLADSDLLIRFSPFVFDKIKAKTAYQFFNLSPEQKDAVYGRIYALAIEAGEVIEESDHSYGENYVFDSEVRLERVLSEILETHP